MTTYRVNGVEVSREEFLKGSRWKGEKAPAATRNFSSPKFSPQLGNITDWKNKTERCSYSSWRDLERKAKERGYEVDSGPGEPDIT